LSKEATWIDGEIASAVIAPPQAVESYAPAAHWQERQVVPDAASQLVDASDLKTAGFGVPSLVPK